MSSPFARAARLCAALAVLIAASACLSPPPPPVTVNDRPVRAPRPALSAAALSAINADLRMVGNDTTWVVRGTGYELVARSRADIPELQRPLDDVARSFHRVFNADPAPVVVTVRHPTYDGSGPQGAAPLPDGVSGDIVEVVLSDDQEMPAAGGDARGGTRGTNGGGRGGRGDGGAPPARDDVGRGSIAASTGKVTRAWLAIRESGVSGKPAAPTVRSGDSDDPDIAAWIESGIPGLLAGMPREDQVTSQLAAHPDSLYPLRTLLTMTTRPATLRVTPGSAPSGGGSAGRGGGGGGGMGGGRGGMGGRGGGGGGGMGGGRGGMGGRGGGGAPPDMARMLPALRGGALFDAQSALFMRFLVAREGYPFVGTVVDAIVRGKTASDAFESAKILPPDLDRIEDDWHRWLVARGTRAGM